MKHPLLIFGLIIIFSTFVYGQDNRLIYPKKVSNATARTDEILQRDEAYVSVDFVEIDLETLLHHEQLIVHFGENNFLINKERINVRGVNNFCFVGKDSLYNRILISIYEESIQGIIETLSENYAIETIGNNDFAIIKIDYSKIKKCGGIEEDDDIEEDDEVKENNTLDTDYSNNLNKENYDSSNSPILSSKDVRDCKIRVLVLYTMDVPVFTPYVKNFVLTAVELANDAFIRSNINYQIELVYAGLTNYAETDTTKADFRKSLRRFRNDGDGYMDEVHSLRDKYSADICVLFIVNNAYCGLASGINVGKNNAFCAVCTYTSCVYYHTFAHEIGHLVGCRHDYYMDANLVPHTYCHGYINPSMTWRTIMAYDNACEKAGCYCPTKGFFSNPNVYYNGEPTGTSYLCNNARVWNEHSDNIMSFRQPDNNVIFTGSDYTNSFYGDVMAKQNITTSGTVNVSSGNTLHMSAGNSITLLPGFSAQAGSEFSAKIENIVDCGTKGNAPKVLIQSMPDEDEEIVEVADIDNIKVFDFSYKVYPNPSNEFINIQYLLNTEITISIDLLNFLGQRVKKILPIQNQPAGNYELQIPISELATGTYFLTFSSANQTKIEKIIINK